MGCPWDNGLMVEVVRNYHFASMRLWVRVYACSIIAQVNPTPYMLGFKWVETMTNIEEPFFCVFFFKKKNNNNMHELFLFILLFNYYIYELLNE
jgi:hypothetical protein